MADDLGNIEIGVVFRDRGDGMKKAVTVAERLERQLDKLVKAANQGSISQQRFQQKLIIAGRELKKNSDMTGNQAYGAVVKYTNAIRKQIVAQENSSVAMQKNTQVVKSAYVAQQALGKGMNRTGVIAQQAGYQFGDFFVQVQSGTNVMVAFGQQATQLIGTFAMLAKSTRAIMLLSGLGVVVPILTAIAAGIMRTKEAAEGAEEKVKTFEDRLRSSQTAIDSAQNSVINLTNKGLENLREKFGAVTTEVIALEDRLNRIELKAMTTEIQEAMNSLFSPEFFSAIEDKFGAIGSAIAESTTEEIEFTRQEIKYLEQTIQNSNFAMPELEGQLVTLREELAAMTGDFENMGSLKDELTLSHRTIEAYKELETAIKSATAEGNFQAAADGISKMLLLFEGVGIEIDSGALANMSRLEAVLREAVATLDDAGPLALTLSEYFGDAADEAQRMALNLQQAAMSAEQTAKGNITVMVAQMKALNAGQDEYIAGARARLKLEKAAYQETLVAAGLSVREAELATENNFKHRDAALETTEAYRELQESLKGVGNKGPKSAEDTRTAYEKAMMTAKEFADALDQQVIGAVDGVADAFSTFLQNGMKDFKSFVGSIKDMFIKLLADMAAMALKRRILIPIAAGMAGSFGSVAGATTTANLVAAGGTAGTLATGASSFGAGLQASLGLGGFTSAGAFNVGANAAVATAATGAGASATMATLGAAVPLIAAGVALFSLFGGGSKPAISPENMNKVNQALEMTGQELGDTGREAEMAAAALGQVAGGFDKLTQKAQFFYENFYSEAERQQIATEKATDQITKAFEDLNMAVPETRDQFRALVEAQDLMTEEGRDTYNALLDVAQAFAFVKKESQGLSEVEKQRAISDREKLFAERQAQRRAEGLTGRGGAVDTSEMSFFERASETVAALNAMYTDPKTGFLKSIKEQGEMFTDMLGSIKSLNSTFSAGNIGLTDFLQKASEFAEKTAESFTGLAESTLRASTDIGLASGGMAFSTETLSNFISGIQSRGAGAAQAMGQQFAQGGAGVSQGISEAYNFFNDLANFVAGPITRAMGGLRENLGTLRSSLQGLEDAERVASEALDLARENGQMVTEAQMGYYNDLTNNIGLTQEAAEVAVAEMQRLREVSIVIPEQAAALEAAVLANLSGGVVDTARMVQLVGTYGANLGKQIAVALANAANAGIQGVMSAFGQFGSLYSAGAITKTQYQSLTKEITGFLDVAKSTGGGGGGGGGGGSAISQFRDSMKSFVKSVEDSIQALKGLKAEEDELGGSRRREVAYLKSVRDINKENLDQIKKSIDAVKNIDEEDYATRFEYMREVGRTINLLESLKRVRGPASLGERVIESLSRPDAPKVITRPNPAQSSAQDTANEVKQLRSDMNAAMSSIAKFTRKTADTLNKFDYDGLPDSRGF